MATSRYAAKQTRRPAAKSPAVDHELESSRFPFWTVGASTFDMREVIAAASEERPVLAAVTRLQDWYKTPGGKAYLAEQQQIEAAAKADLETETARRVRQADECLSILAADAAKGRPVPFLTESGLRDGTREVKLGDLLALVERAAKVESSKQLSGHYAEAVDLLARFHNTDEGWEYFAQEADAAAAKALADEGEAKARHARALTDLDRDHPRPQPGTGKSGKGNKPAPGPSQADLDVLAAQQAVRDLKHEALFGGPAYR